ncbi:MAG TPA: TraB/GumN family protein, partial [Flavisolibacter sp.]|nr:TraB/GumN family protein [Flavisolibacter sp.]
MLRFVLRGSISVLFLLFTLSSFSQTKWPNTLLWRISGKGLEKPSYLFGTMHLQDKRLFQFGDSLYYALEKTDGFAMEIDVAEMMDSIMTNAVKEAEKEHLLERQQVRLNRKKLGKSADSLLRSYGIKGDVATKKDLKKIRDRRAAALLRQGEMPTIVDAYLLGLAKRMDKWTGGIEDVRDQLDLSDEIGGTLEPESVLMPENSFKTSIEQMIAVYLAQDLNKLEEISNSGFSSTDRDIILINRNIKMAYRMDSLAHVRPMFFAVGAAHLPGDSGVIRLLQNDGYKVEPVFSSAKTDAAQYAAKLGEQSWVTIEGDNKAYTVQMPGKASDQNMYGDVLKLKIYFDMTTMSFYFSGSIAGAQIDQAKLDTLMEGMVNNITKKKVAIASKVVQTAGITGKEAVADGEDASYRVQVFAKDQTVFFLMMGAMKKDNLQSADASRFFTSFVPGKTTVEKKEWETFSLKGKAFSIRMPGTPSRNEAMDKQIAENSNWKSESYQAIDPLKGAYYLVQVREMKDRYYLEGDSAYFELLKADFESRADEVLSTQVTTYQG